MDFGGLTVAQSMAWQTATAAIQAITSVGLLGWYLWAAHLERVRARREKAEAFESLVWLCYDLGHEARAKTDAHLAAARGALAQGDGGAPALFAAWKEDMVVIYVCLDEVPHYEVRSPAFSTALTRLWLEVDAKDIDYSEAGELVPFLARKHERICREVDSMAQLLGPHPPLRGYPSIDRHPGSPALARLRPG